MVLEEVTDLMVGACRIVKLMSGCPSDVKRQPLFSDRYSHGLGSDSTPR